MLKQDLMDLEWPFTAMRRWLWLVVGCPMLSAVVAFAFCTWMPPVYKTTATLLVQPSSGLSTNEFNALAAGERLAVTYAQMLKGDSTLRQVIARLGLDNTPQELARQITAEPIRDTQLVSLTVTDSSPDRAALLANAVVDAFIAQIRSLQEERFSGTLENLRRRMSELSGKIEETEATIESARQDKIENDVALAHLENLLVEQRNDYRMFQQNYEQARLLIARMTGGPVIVEAAKAVETSGQSLYTATVTLLISQPPSSEGTDYFASPTSGPQTLTYSELLVGRAVLESAIATLELAETPETLLEKIKVVSVPNTQLVRLSVQDNDSAQAALIANTIAQTFVGQIRTLRSEPYAGYLSSIQEQLNSLSSSIEEAQSTIEALSATKVVNEAELASLERVVAGYRGDYQTLQDRYEELNAAMAQSMDTVIATERAPIPGSPVRVRTLYTLLAAGIGLIAGVGAAFFLERFSPRIHTRSDVNEALGLGTLGMIGRLNGNEDDLVVIKQPRSPVAEDFRVLGASLRTSLVRGRSSGNTRDRAVKGAKPKVANVSDQGNSLRTVLVASPGPREGRTVVAANLGASLARDGLKVILVDADLCRPRLHEIFSLDQNPGLTTWLSGESTNNWLKPSCVPGLEVLTSGEVLPNSADALGRKAVTEILCELSQEADLVLIDSSPGSLVADAMVLGPLVDGVLLVLRAGYTEVQEARHVMESLHRVGANLVGVVLNAVPDRKSNHLSPSEDA